MTLWISTEERAPTKEFLEDGGFVADRVWIWSAHGAGWVSVENWVEDVSGAVITHWMPIKPPGAELDTDNPPSDWTAITQPSPADRAMLADKHMAQLRELTEGIVDWIDGVMEDRAIRKIEMRECIEEVLAEKAKAAAAADA